MGRTEGFFLALHSGVTPDSSLLPRWGFKPEPVTPLLSSLCYGFYFIYWRGEGRSGIIPGRLKGHMA